MVLSFWYVVLPGNPITDVALLAYAAAVVMAKVFDQVYPSPHDRLHMEALGTAMWIRTGLFSILSVRRVKGVGFGFWPDAREWGIGTLYFAGLLPIAAGLGWWIGFTRPHGLLDGWITLLPLTFFGTLWVLALGEELFFRGLLQQWMSGWLANEWLGLIATSVIFGAVHLWYHDFPNWRFAMLAGIAGIFYGLAFRQGKGIRASMVTHALTVTTWKMFFS
jgi:membrane protease YdiL (CAAX protease family)